MAACCTLKTLVLCRCQWPGVAVLQPMWIWCALTGSNRRHSPCKGDALPAELSAHPGGSGSRPRAAPEDREGYANRPRHSTIRGKSRHSGSARKLLNKKRKCHRGDAWAGPAGGATRVNPSGLHSSLPTPWWTKNSPSGSYLAFTARRRAWWASPQNDACHVGSK